MSAPVLGIGILSVPQRRQRLATMLESLGLPPTVVALDVNHQGHVFNWWQAADIACRQAIQGTKKPTHALVIEDDAVPCPDFLKVVQQLVEQYPDRTLSFFTRDPVVKTARPGSLVMVKDVPTDLAVVYPVTWLKQLKKDYLAVIDTFDRKRRRWGYGADEMRAELRPEKVVWATVPSLVEHGCPLKSTLAHFYPSNVAARFIGANTSALMIDWKAEQS